MVYTIYVATNTVNNKHYVGFDSNWPQRRDDHKKYSRYAYKTEALYCAIRKHGWDKFEWEVVYQSLDKDHTKNVMESYFITAYQSHIDSGCGYNMTSGGDGSNDCPTESRQRMGWSRGLTIGPHSPERRAAISAAKKAQQLTHTAERKEQIRQARLGSKSSEGCIRKKSKDYIATAPDGTEYMFYNLNRFCKEHELNQSAMSKVARGIATHHKGWTVDFCP